MFATALRSVAGRNSASLSRLRLGWKNCGVQAQPAFKHWKPLVLQPSTIPPFPPSMDFDHLIIDGYNLLHQDEALDGRRDDLQTARQRLVRRIERAAPEMAPRISVVFDGRERGRDASFDAPHLEVLFSPANRTADAVIERMVATAKKPERICVVTSDRIEEQIVSAAGAFVVSCLEFTRRCDAAEGSSAPFQLRKSREKKSTLGDFFPPIEEMK